MDAYFSQGCYCEVNTTKPTGRSTHFADSVFRVDKPHGSCTSDLRYLHNSKKFTQSLFWLILATGGSYPRASCLVVFTDEINDYYFLSFIFLQLL